MDKNIYIISSRYCGRKHVSYNTILGLENEFTNICHAEIFCFSKRIFWFNKVLRKLKIGRQILDKKIIKEIIRTDKKCFFASMNIIDLVEFKYSLQFIKEHLILYIFDCWEKQWNQYEEIFNEIDPWAICFAYKKAANHFSLVRKNCWFMPQSMDIRYFHDYNIEKSRLFMQMGRRTEPLHDIVISYLESKNIEDNEKNYVYEKRGGNIIFPDTNILAQEISKTYFFIAAPQDVTNNQLTGNISEVTARFYEAMACKSLIIGIKPSDTFDELFPYQEAMIEVNLTNFNQKIEFLLEDKEKYIKIVNKNHDYVMKNHRWKNRYEDLIQKIISESI